MRKKKSGGGSVTLMGEKVRQVNVPESTVAKIREIAKEKKMSMWGVVQTLVESDHSRVDWVGHAVMFPDSGTQAKARWKELEDTIALYISKASATASEIAAGTKFSEKQVKRALRNLLAAKTAVRVKGRKYKGKLPDSVSGPSGI